MTYRPSNALWHVLISSQSVKLINSVSITHCQQQIPRSVVSPRYGKGGSASSFKKALCFLVAARMDCSISISS